MLITLPYRAEKIEWDDLCKVLSTVHVVRIQLISALLLLETGNVFIIRDKK